MRVYSIFSALCVAVCIAAYSSLLHAGSLSTKPQKSSEQDWVASFAIIDKLTAKTEVMAAGIGSIISHEKLEIHVRKCWVEPKPTLPEHAALVEMYIKNAVKRKQDKVFTGWLFSKNTELSNLEHPNYDVQLLSCISSADNIRSDR